MSTINRNVFVYLYILNQKHINYRILKRIKTKNRDKSISILIENSV